MRWRKLGLVYAPSGEQWWARSHTHLPTVEVIDDAVVRVYFAALDDRQYGRVAFVDLDARDLRRVTYVAPEPVLDLGELGAFDDCGVVPSCVIRTGDTRRLYYVGFQRAQRVPYMLFSGLAVSTGEAGGFKRVSRTPILDRSDDEPFSRSAPYVRFDDGRYQMWYWSCVRWTERDGAVNYNNVIRYATSDDGVRWVTDPHICIEPDFRDEYSIGRPCVLYGPSGYQMWYSIRSFSKQYAIGYAESSDGVQWIRKDDEVGIARSDSGWDSQMICYPVVVDIRGERYMFYNGNRHGASGFGVAILET